MSFFRGVYCRMMMTFDFAWGCVLGFADKDDFADVILRYIEGITTEFK